MRAGRHVIVLTDRLAQLHDLRGMLLAEGIAAADIAYYVGSTPREEQAPRPARPSSAPTRWPRRGWTSRGSIRW